MYVSVRPMRRRPVSRSPNHPRVMLSTMKSTPVRKNLRLAGLAAPEEAGLEEGVPPLSSTSEVSKNRRAGETSRIEPKREAGAARQNAPPSQARDGTAPRSMAEAPAVHTVLPHGSPRSPKARAKGADRDARVDAKKDGERKERPAPAAAPESSKARPMDQGANRDSKPASRMESKQQESATRKTTATDKARDKTAKKKRSAKASQVKADDSKPHPQGAITAYEFSRGMTDLRDFQSGARTATHPDGTPLELLFENKRFSIFYAEVNGLLCMYSDARFDIPASYIYKTLTDYDYQKTYDSYIKHKSIIDNVDGNEVVFHEVKLPPPLKNRDYVYYRKCIVDEQAGVYQWYQRDLPDWGRGQREEVKGVIRAGRGDFWLQCQLQKTGENSCRMVTLQQDNPAGDVPKWLLNFVTKKGIPSYFKGVETAAQQLRVDEGEMTKKDFKAWQKAYNSTV